MNFLAKKWTSENEEFSRIFLLNKWDKFSYEIKSGLTSNALVQKLVLKSLLWKWKGEYMMQHFNVWKSESSKPLAISQLFTFSSLNTRTVNVAPRCDFLILQNLLNGQTSWTIPSKLWCKKSNFFGRFTSLANLKIHTLEQHCHSNNLRWQITGKTGQHDKLVSIIWYNWINQLSKRSNAISR